MLGLEGYSSSDEEGGEVAAPQVKESTLFTTSAVPGVAEQLPSAPTAQPPAAPAASEPPQDLPIGPVSGPSFPPQETINTLPELPDADASSAPPSAPSSPYIRSLAQSLTLPTHPNTSIPPSPPGSPIASTTAKIRKFLDLKSRGVHFNEKLASSSALANPEMLKGLLEFAGVDAEFEQYASVLGEDVMVVKRQGESVYWEELNASQERIGKRREEERRGSKRVFVREGEAKEGEEGKRRKG